MRIHPFVLVAGLAVLSLAPLGAQAPTSQVTPGSRVRVRVDTPPPGRTVVGTVSTFGADTLALTPSGGGAVERYPLTAIRQLEVSRGRGVVGSHVIIGTLAGALAGGLIAGASSSCSSDQWFCFQGLAMMGGVVLGGAVGAGVGALIKGEKWRSVPLGPSVSISPVAGRGVGVFVRFEF